MYVCVFVCTLIRVEGWRRSDAVVQSDEGKQKEYLRLCLRIYDMKAGH